MTAEAHSAWRSFNAILKQQEKREIKTDESILCDECYAAWRRFQWDEAEKHRQLCAAEFKKFKEHGFEPHQLDQRAMADAGFKDRIWRCVAKRDQDKRRKGGVEF